MLTSTDTVLVIGTDQRPKGSKEPGAFAGGIRSDTMMLWRIGGGTSRRLSIPRDTIVADPRPRDDEDQRRLLLRRPGTGDQDGREPHRGQDQPLIIVNLANFPKFIDAIGGVDVTTGRICSQISGGVQKGGFSLFLRPGTHHLDGRDALTLARTRENTCNRRATTSPVRPTSSRSSTRSSPSCCPQAIFFRLPWASWDAPQAVRTDMGGLTLITLFAAAEIGGSAPTQILQDNHLPLPDVESVRRAGRRFAARSRKLMNG